MCAHRCTWASQQDDRLQLCIAGHLITAHFIDARVAQKLHRFQDINLQNLVDIEEIIQYPKKGSNLKRLKKKKKGTNQQLSAHYLLLGSPWLRPRPLLHTSVTGLT